MFDWAFGDFVSLEEQDKAKNRVQLRHHGLVKDRLSNHHVDAICEQFAEAMQESWIEQDVMNIATKHLLQCLHQILSKPEQSQDREWMVFQYQDGKNQSSTTTTMVSLDKAAAQAATISKSGKDRSNEVAGSNKVKMMTLFHNLTPRAA